jgi:hypothetical protein
VTYHTAWPQTQGHWCAWVATVIAGMQGMVTRIKIVLEVVNQIIGATARARIWVSPIGLVFQAACALRSTPADGFSLGGVVKLPPTAAALRELLECSREREAGSTAWLRTNSYFWSSDRSLIY